MNESALITWTERVRSKSWGETPKPWREVVASRAKEDFLLGIAVHPNGQLESTDAAELPAHLAQPVLSLFSDAFSLLAGNKEFVASLNKEFVAVVCLHDSGRVVPDLAAPLFTFNRMKGDSDLFLQPDPINIGILGGNKNYPLIDQVRHKCPWEQRHQTLFWRGSSTGVPYLTPGTWRENPRVKLSLFSRDYGDKSMLDMGLSQVVQNGDFDPEIIAREGIMLPNVEQLNFMLYRYLLDIDGNANAWGLLQKLFFGSTVFKVSTQYEQWFYSQLEPWKNFIPVELTLDSLVGAVKFARENDSTARAIAENGTALARSIDYKSIVDFHADTLLKISQINLN